MTRTAPLPAAQVTTAARTYLRTEAGGAFLLLLATMTAIAWVNSPFADSYAALWETELAMRLGERELTDDLRHWVNDGLMTMFFLVVGLEIARELSVGEYRDRRAVVAPALAALGGLVVPALVYLAIAGNEAARGWGVAISTDTAFALGILALVGPRCPNRLRIFLLALAIIDDIAAIGVIALFYTDDVDLVALAVAAALLGGLAGLRRARVMSPAPYVLVGVLVWLATRESGVHPTVAGVVMGLLFASYLPSEQQLQQIPSMGRSFLSAPSAERAREVVRSVSGSLPFNDRLSLRLHPVISFVVVPLFALANAGVALDGDALRSALASPVAVGIAVALVVGKLVGVLAGTWVALRVPSATFVGGVRWGQVTGVAAVAGIGFTIALFIADLAFSDPDVQQDAKIGILVGSSLAALVALLVFRVLAYRGGLCYPEDAPNELPPLAQIPDPE